MTTSKTFKNFLLPLYVYKCTSVDTVLISLDLIPAFDASCAMLKLVVATPDKRKVPGAPCLEVCCGFVRFQHTCNLLIVEGLETTRLSWTALLRRLLRR